MRLTQILHALAALTLLVSCSGEQNRYSEYRSLPDDGWRYDDVLEFMPVHSDTLCAGRLVVGLRHDDTYPYKDIYLEISCRDGTLDRTDTMAIHVTDSYGKWLGHGIGMSFQLADTSGRVLHPSATPVRVRHLMRTDTLCGIRQLGVFFVPESGR